MSCHSAYEMNLGLFVFNIYLFTSPLESIFSYISWIFIEAFTWAQVAEDEKHIFKSSMLMILDEYGALPHVTNASALTKSIKVFVYIKVQIIFCKFSLTPQYLHSSLH